MAKKIFAGIGVAIALFLVFVSMKSGKFRYERSGVINAPAENVYRYISDFKRGKLWNPYAQKDPNMKTNFIGPDAQVGSIMEFDGNSEAGAGKLEIIKLVPNQSVDIRLIMTSPFYAENLIEYRLTPEGAGTRFSWAMSGDGGFMGKLISTVFDCEKMIAGDFETGIARLKTVVEAEKK